MSVEILVLDEDCRRIVIIVKCVLDVLFDGLRNAVCGEANGSNKGDVEVALCGRLAGSVGKSTVALDSRLDRPGLVLEALVARAACA